MGLAAKNSKSNSSSPQKRIGGIQYVVCVRNESYSASFELRKIYSLIPDKIATKSGLLRVIDESGEDYVYPEDYFVAIKLPRTVHRAVQLAS